MSTPTLSIITVCLNRADYIVEAVESVLQQGESRVEHIIVDGGSTDGTLEKLKQYPHLKVISEPDEGMYDAINKGFRVATGDVVGLLNSDDMYPAGCFQVVREAFAKIPDAAAVVGGAEFMDERGNRTARCLPPIKSDDFWERMIQESFIPNAWFFQREILARFIPFNIHYRIAADRDLWIRAALAGIRPVPVEQVLYRYRQHDRSATISSQDSRLETRGLQRLKVLLEELEIYEHFLSLSELPHQASRILQRAHSERCYRLFATAFYHHHYRLAASAVPRGFHRNPLWLFHAVFYAFRRIFKGLNQHDNP